MQSLKELKKLEILAQRKACVYGRTLTDVQLAKLMQELVSLHGDRAEKLSLLLGEECKAKVEVEEDEAGKTGSDSE